MVVRLKEVRLRRFKRFTDTTITNLPDTARLCLIAGPNGCGKSSFFEALNVWKRKHKLGVTWDEHYYVKNPEEGNIGRDQAISLDFHGGTPQSPQKSIYIRSAYRNDPQFSLKSLSKMASAVDEDRLPTLISNDAVVGQNYQRLATQALEDAFENEAASTTIGEFRNKTIGDISKATRRLFPDLLLNSLGNPIVTGTFKFDKGNTKGFQYRNLSGGEKAAFDLILDITVKRREYDDTVFCIDEPEAHMNTRLQGALLRELFDATGQDCQLWLTTHSVGMMRAARDLAQEHLGEVIFLDFGGRDFDESQVIEPEAPTRVFWQRVLDVGFDDFAALIAPSEVVLCEGAPLGQQGPSAGLDAQIYEVIFGSEFPDTRFIAAGNSQQVETDRIALIQAMQALVQGTTVRRLIDRDDLSDAEVVERRTEGIAVLGRRNLESYLFDDEVIRSLAEQHKQAALADLLVHHKRELLQQAHRDEKRRRPLDDVKASAGPIMEEIRRTLSLTRTGNNVKSFMRDTLAPLVVPDTAIYQELRASVFPHLAAAAPAATNEDVAA